MKEMPWILPPPKSRFSDQTFSRIVRPDVHIIPPPSSSPMLGERSSGIVRPNVHIPSRQSSFVLDELDEGLSHIDGLNNHIPAQLSSPALDVGLSHIVRPNIYISPPISSIVLDESPSHIVGPNAQELQIIKNMILTLQSDLQEERTKRESLEERMREFEGYPNQ
jgi:hypothetical protein